jgi:AraC family transcriptional regulator of adaptative response/methylated-DNA-[protein]-cysteine methyltransferase
MTIALHEAHSVSTRGTEKRRSGASRKTAAIRYTLVPCSLGRLLLAGTDEGVCAVYLGDSDEPLERELNRGFPSATLSREDAGLLPWAEAVRSSLEDGQAPLDVPLDARGTVFQWSVWRQLLLIPRGTTRTYQQIAKALGQPTAARAVARACATNPVSVVIPCHRVIRGDGDLGGYRWGLHRKQALLDRERDALERSAPRKR